MQTLLVLTILGLITGDPIVGLLGGAGAGHGSEQEQGHHGVGHSAVLHGDRRHDYTIHYLPSHHGYTIHHPHTVEHIVRRSVEAEPSNKIQELGESKDVLQDRSGLFGYGYGGYGLGGLGYGLAGFGYGLGGLGYGLGYGLGGYGLGYGGLGLWKRSADEEVKTSHKKSKRSANPYYGLGFGGLYGLGGFGYGLGGLYGHGLYGGHFWKRSSDKEENFTMAKSKRSANPYFGLGYGGLYGLGGYGYGLGGLYGHGLYGGHFWKRSTLDTQAALETEKSTNNVSISRNKRSANPYYGLGFGGLYGLGGFGYGFGGLYGHGLYGGHFWKRSTDEDEKSLLSVSKRSAEPFFGGYGYGGYGHHHHHHHYSHHGYGHW